MFHLKGSHKHKKQHAENIILGEGWSQRLSPTQEVARNGAAEIERLHDFIFTHHHRRYFTKEKTSDSSDEYWQKWSLYIYIHDSTYNYYGNFRGFAGKKPTEKKLRASRIFLALAASAIMAITTRLSFIMFGKEIGVGSRKHASASATTNALKEKRLLKVQAVTCVRACRV